MRTISRREFLKASAAGTVGLFLKPDRFFQASQSGLPDFPEGERLGRIFGGRVPVKVRPDIDSADVKVLMEDDVVLWLRELVGSRPMWYSQRFVETPDGYVYAANLQPVRNLPNQPLLSLPDPAGFWAEVTVPYVDLILQNPPGRAPWLGFTPRPRLYYSQVMFVDSLRNDEDGQVYYRVVEKYGTFGDVFWVPAEAMRPITAGEITPIHPEVEDKRVVVNLSSQTMSCYEGKTEVFYSRVSTGGKYDKDGNPSDKWSTPVGSNSIWRKLVSVHMTGGTAGGGYDLPGIGWTTLFSGNGVAVHSTFWHNSFGTIMSHGCVNARPEDAKWVFRWTNPTAPYDSGDVTVQGQGSTKVIVVEG